MIEEFYKYNRYMMGIGVLVEDGMTDILEQINSDLDSFIYLWTKDKSVLKLITEGYIKYNILEAEDIENIDNYFKDENNNKDVVKIIKKCNKLKSEN